ncbi:hypothetical protein [Rhodospirillum sp. A1_3_36]|uniref:hypothetical protein n=1 Tax=Rhodospirillum sp. A1_3_36 TaxID=3391666 RepID=UPI0039A71703
MPRPLLPGRLLPRRPQGRPQGRPRGRLDHRRVRDRSTVLLAVGVALLLPPLAGVSLIDVQVLGVPFPLVYLFGVWVGLILGTAGLASTLWVTQQGAREGGGTGSDDSPPERGGETGSASGPGAGGP